MEMMNNRRNFLFFVLLAVALTVLTVVVTSGVVDGRQVYGDGDIFTKGGVRRGGRQPKVKSATHQPKSGLFLGRRYDIEVFGVDYDEDLHYLEADFWCPNVCYQNKTKCKPCDYTEPGKKGCNRNASKKEDDCKCDPDPDGLFCSEKPREIPSVIPYVPEEEGWTKLKFGKWVRNVITRPGGQQFYRFYLDPSEKCRYIRIVAIQRMGEIRINVATPSSWETDHPYIIGRGSHFQTNEVSICPSDDGFYEPGTYYLSVTAFAHPVLEYDIMVELVDLPPDPPEVPVCQEVIEGQGCLTPGVPLIKEFDWYSDFQTKVTVTLPKASIDDGTSCPEIYVATAQAQSLDYLSDQDVSLSFFDPNVTHVNYIDIGEVIGAFLGNDKYTFSVCLNPHQETTIYLEFYSFPGVGVIYSWLARYIVTPVATFRRIPLTQLPEEEYRLRMYGRSRLECGDQVFQCRYYYEGAGSVQYPDVDSQPFWPPPTFYDYPHPTPLGRIFGNMSMLESVLDRPLTNRFYGQIWFKSQNSNHLQRAVPRATVDVESCQLKFANGIVTKDLIPLATVANFTKRRSDCDLDSLKALDEKFQDLADQIKTEEDVATGLHLRATIDVLTYSDNFTDCLDMANTLLQRDGVTNRTFPDSSACLTNPTDPNFSFDPCCHPDETMDSSQCCLPKTITVSEQEYKPKRSKINSCPGDNECVESYTSDFVLEKKKFEAVIDGCNNPSREVTELFREEYDPYVTCRDKYFGANHTVGIECKKDSDCIDNKCNVVTGYCLNNIRKMERLFLKCMFEKLDPYIVDYLREKYNIKEKVPTSDGFQEKIYDAWSTRDCVAERELGLPFRESWTFTLQPFGDETSIFFCGNSSVGYTKELDNRAILPVEWTAIWGTACPGDWYAPSKGPSEKACEKSKVCNWFNCTEAGLSLSECKKECLSKKHSDFFCGICENDVECIEFPEITTEEECKAKVACIVDGAVNATTKTECRKKSYCSAPCYITDGEGVPLEEVECQTQSECEASGVCGRAFDLFGSSYGCVYVLPTIQSCGFTSLIGSMTTEIGCLNFQTDPYTCEYIGGRWLRAAITKEECEGYGYGCEEELTFDTAVINPTWIMDKPRSTCSKCGGKRVPRMPWHPGKWTKATSRSLEWRKRDFVQKYKFDKTLSFIRIADDLDNAIWRKHIFYLRSEAECRYNKILSLLKTLACDCADGSDGGENCYSKLESSLPSGTALVCPGVETLVSIPPDTVLFPKNAVDKYEKCIEIPISVESALVYQTPPEETVTSFLIGKENPKDPYSFKNEYKAEIGQVFGDGIQLDQDDGKAAEVRLCFASRDDIDIDTKKFPVRDVAIEGDEFGELIPQNLKLRHDPSGRWCVWIEDPKTLYYPVVRIDDWEDEVPYTKAALVLMFVAGALYLFNSVYALMQLVEVVILPALSFSANNHIIWLMMLLNLTRGLYFNLLATQVINDAPDVIDVIMVELPTFFYFASFTLFLAIWLIKVTRLGKVGKFFLGSPWRFAATIIIVNALFFCLFIGLILFFEFLPPENDTKCGGRVQEPIPDWTARRIVNAAYRIAIATVAVLMATLIIAFGGKIFFQLSSKSKRARGLVFFLAFVCAGGLLGQSGYLIYLVVSGVQNNVATIIVLLITEVTPSLVLLFLLHPARQAGLPFFGALFFPSSYSKSGSDSRRISVAPSKITTSGSGGSSGSNSSSKISWPATQSQSVENSTN